VTEPATWDPKHHHRMLVSDYNAAVAAAKAERRCAETEDQRPAVPSRPSGSEGGVRGDPRDLLRHILDLLQGGEADKAVELIRQFLGASDGPPEGDEVTAGKSLLDPRMKARLQEAFRDLQSGPAALEAAQARIRKDKDLLRFVDSAVQRPSAERRLLRSIDRAVQGDR
jgi:hypothetical protein